MSFFVIGSLGCCWVFGWLCCWVRWIVGWSCFVGCFVGVKWWNVGWFVWWWWFVFFVCVCVWIEWWVIYLGIWFGFLLLWVGCWIVLFSRVGCIGLVVNVWVGGCCVVKVGVWVCLGILLYGCLFCRLWMCSRFFWVIGINVCFVLCYVVVWSGLLVVWLWCGDCRKFVLVSVRCVFFCCWWWIVCLGVNVWVCVVGVGFVWFFRFGVIVCLVLEV